MSDGAPALAATRAPRRAVATALALLALLALVLRWSVVRPREGDELKPRPDVLEYVAGAQAIAQEGRYFLQLGPERLPPRYPPGWSLVYAAGLRAGVPPERLWRITAAADVASLVALAALAAALARRSLADLGTRAARWAPLGAALVCGLVLAGTGGRLRLALTGLAEPGALAGSLAALAAGAYGLLAPTSVARRRAALVAAGAAGLLSAAIRPYDGVAAAVAGLALVAWAARRRGSATTLRELVWPVAGALAVATLVGIVLVRSGRPAWQWTAYSFWIPSYATVDEWLSPWGMFAREPGDERRSGLRFAADALLGHSDSLVRPLRMVPGLPLAGLAALGWALGRVAGRRGRGATALDGLSFALTAWFAAHVLVYTVYEWRIERYYYVPGALLAAAGAWGAAVALARGTAPARAAAALLVGWALTLAAADLAGAVDAKPRRDRRPELRRRVEAAVARWERLPPRRRARSTLAFDPLEAQALGVVPLARAAEYRWGAELPPTEQVERLAALRRARAAPPAADSVDTPGGGP